MRSALLVFLLFSLAVVPTVARPALPSDYAQDQPPQGEEQSPSYQPFDADQLDNLLSPIALYPDPLLAQVLVAATFPDQVEEAARWVRGNGQAGIDDQNWDISVKAVAHYPSVVEMMADKSDWTTSVGQAYVNQGADVSAAVQRLRHLAHNLGNLQTTPQQEVLVDGDYIAIDPVTPQYIYVPVYDPAICFYRRPYWGPAVVFGVGFPIGAWLNLDFRWGFGSPWGGVFYTGWRPWGGWHDRWITRCRPYVHITNVYVNNRYTNITVNRTVINRTVNVTNINHFNYVHKNVTYNNVQTNNERVNRVNNVRVNNGQNNRVEVNNKMLNRNINTNNTRLNEFRGQQNPPRSDRPPQGLQNRPDLRQQNRPPAQPQNRPAVEAPRQTPAPAPHTFGRSEGNFDPRASSSRGQSSRAEVSRAPRTYSPPPRSAGGGGHPSGGGHQGGGGRPSGGRRP